MSGVQRKKSPRAPSMPLDEAIERAIRVYGKQKRHAAPVDLVAQHMGYSGAKNGTALGAIASLRYFGLLERPQEGRLSVSKDVESYQFAPSEQMRRELLIKWLKSPPVFAELLEKYKDGGLPSDANIKFDLIQLGFSSSAADTCNAVFQRSVEFARYLEHDDLEPVESSTLSPEQPESRVLEAVGESSPVEDAPKQISGHGTPPSLADLDRIPVRLGGGRKAWLEIPIPFFDSDKARLKAQIDLLITDDDVAEDAST